MGTWHQLDAAQVLSELGSGSVGLDEAEANRRLAQCGPNELTERGLKNPWAIFWSQLTGTLILILIFAAIVSLALGDTKDTIAILTIVLLNAALGFSQEYKAEKGMAALRKLAVPTVKVRRSGVIAEFSARALVPGDIVLFEAGDLVPADCRILESVSLRMREAALTGESEPVDKVSEALDSVELALGDRRNMAYMGTAVSYGRGLGVVTETGMNTELGRIATLIQTMGAEATPLQRRLDQLGKVLALAVLILVAVIFGMGLLRGEHLKVMFLTAVSIGVAAVPEGLPAVVTIALALGAQRMLKRKALIRKLSAVEALGSVTVICSDKTGTLTENEMSVIALDLLDHSLEIGNGGANGGGVELREEMAHLQKEHPSAALLLAGGALCNDAAAGSSTTAGPAQMLGDPTEIALVEAASRWGLPKPELDSAFRRVAEAPFESDRKRMTTVHRMPSAMAELPALLKAALNGNHDQGTARPSFISFTKGAADSLLEVSSGVWIAGQLETLNESWRKRIAAANDQLARTGMRVLGVAFRLLDTLPDETRSDDLEHDLIFLGLVGMIDPPRREATLAVATCKRAGIRPVMVTGDHPLTARYIAEELGIADDSATLTGQQLAHMSPRDLEKVVDEVSIYARVSPEHKLNIVQALQNRGHIVAMTGDGVNDAPALKKADIGVAMGIEGTDVAKEAADMVLLDDNFATIVAAVEEGRVIYDNIRKFIKYILATNSGEIWVMLLTPFIGMPLALLPLQILWMNLVTDGLPALALGVEPAERNTMARPPRRQAASIFAGGAMGRHILWIGLLMGLQSAGVGYAYWHAGSARWQTMLFTTLTLSQMAHVMAIRSGRSSLFAVGIFSNKPLLYAVSLTVVLQLALVQIPFLQSLFKTVSLTAGDLALSLALSAVIFWSVEFEKWFRRRAAARRA